MTKSDSLRQRKLSAENPEVFRACLLSTVLHSFAVVFEARITGIVGAGTVKPEEVKLQDTDHSEADAIFYEGAVVRAIDYFISHVWTAPRWSKALALHYHANIVAATSVATLFWLGAAVVLVYSKGISAYGGRADLLVPVLVWFPLSTFFVVFFFGHMMFPWLGRKQVWLDKLCIHQTRIDLKVLGVTALPEFVANSNRMLILWSEAYFERLWCNAEIATFCSLNGAENIDFLPLWLPPWVLVTILVDVGCMWLFDNRLSILIPMAGSFIAERFGDSPNLVIFLTQAFGIGLSLGLSYMPAVLFNYISFSRKIRLHDMMLQQLRDYKFHNAKCTVESDRAIVEKEVTELFGEMDHLGKNSDSPDAGPVERFNSYINNEFADTIEAQVGSVSKMPWTMCVLVFMPLNFEALANVLGCDGLPCEESWVAEGFSSMPQYIVTNTLMWSHGILLIYPTTYPVLLRGMEYFTRKLDGYPLLRASSCILTIAAAYMYMGFLMGSVCGFISTAIISGEPIWYTAWALSVAVLLYWNYFLFKGRAAVGQKVSIHGDYRPLPLPQPMSPCVLAVTSKVRALSASL
ncbi:unnamed protein product [Polarella glacialis]|uniref:Transmembrane protein n=1 Tax=Polarella glacialis TaxID=89957 RepID=A0A813INW5_POLGL|nr:unnamed protein product [Polarella glacialis]CAE8653661.1 unnamed protein product [Polarella glacialis]